MPCGTLKERRQDLAFEIRELYTLLSSPLDEGWLVRVIIRPPYPWEGKQRPNVQENEWVPEAVSTIVEL